MGLARGEEFPGEYTFVTFAGPVDTGAGLRDGPVLQARFSSPSGLVADSAGNLYLGDNGSLIRQIDVTGEVTTFAGTGGAFGSADGAGAAARFDFDLCGLGMDPSGNLVLADLRNSVIRRISPNGRVQSIAGLAGQHGSADGDGRTARFLYPSGIAVDAGGTIYVADSLNHTIRRISTSGQVTTLAGLAGRPGGADGLGSAARFYYPRGLALDSLGNLLVADIRNHAIRKVTAAGEVTTLAGALGVSGTADGTGGQARFNGPASVAVDRDGIVVVADSGSHTLRRIDPGTVVTTLTGAAGQAGATDGPAAEARLNSPEAVAFGNGGWVYVVDRGNHSIRAVAANGSVTTIAGSSPQTGEANGPAQDARFQNPTGVAVNASGVVYVADSGNHALRQIQLDGTVTTFAGLSGSSGSADGTGSAARFNQPFGLACDLSNGALYVSDLLNQTVRKVLPSGQVTTFAGSPGEHGVADGLGSAARFDSLLGLAVGPDHEVYVADTINQTIRKISPVGEVTTLAGKPRQAGQTDGLGSSARFNNPTGVAVDGRGTVYVADHGNHTIRAVSPAGQVTTLAGLAGSPGDSDGLGAAARFTLPYGLALGTSGLLFVSEGYTRTIRRMTPAAQVATVGSRSFQVGNAEGTGAFARFSSPVGLALGPAGELYVADGSASSNIRRTVPVCPDVPTLNPALAAAGVSRQLGTTPQTGTAWKWCWIRRPSGSTATVSSLTNRTPVVVPDLGDVYAIQLRTTGASGALSIRTLEFQPTNPPPTLTAPLYSTGVFHVTTGAGRGSQTILEYKDSLDDPIWETASFWEATGHPEALSDTNAAAPRRFYRIRAD